MLEQVLCLAYEGKQLMIDYKKEEAYKFGFYAHKKRWISYWYQINEVLSLEFSNLLIIGSGDNIVPLVLRELLSPKKVNIYTYDYDAQLQPDILADVREIKEKTKALKIDCILCCQVLEHLDFEYFEQIIMDMAEITHYLILSLPHRKRVIGKCSFKLPKINEFFLELALPQRIIQTRHHRWEIGSCGAHIKQSTILQILQKKFILLKKYHVPEISFHLFFILQSKKERI